MSVLTYIYPRDIEPLAIERLLPAVRKLVDQITISELTLKKRGALDWESIVFRHSSVPEFEFLFVATRNTKEDIKHIVQFYRKINKKMLSVVRSTPISIWSQHKAGDFPPLKKFEKSWCIYTELLAAIAQITQGIIDSPECEQIFTSATFRRYNRKHERQRQK